MSSTFPNLLTRFVVKLCLGDLESARIVLFFFFNVNEYIYGISSTVVT